MRLGLGLALGQSQVVAPLPFPATLSGCVSCFVKPNYAAPGGSGTWTDSVAAQNAVQSVTPPAAVSGAPRYTGTENPLVAPAASLAGIPGAANNGDNHFFFALTVDAFTTTDAWFAVFEATNKFYFLLSHPASNTDARIRFLESSTGGNKVADLTLGTNASIVGQRLVFQGKKTGGFIWVRSGLGAWVQGAASAAFSVATLGQLFIGDSTQKGTTAAFACWNRALSSAESDALATYGAAL